MVTSWQNGTHPTTVTSYEHTKPQTSTEAVVLAGHCQQLSDLASSTSNRKDELPREKTRSTSRIQQLSATPVQPLIPAFDIQSCPSSRNSDVEMTASNVCLLSSTNRICGLPMDFTHAGCSRNHMSARRASNKENSCACMKDREP